MKKPIVLLSLLIAILFLVLIFGGWFYGGNFDTSTSEHSFREFTEFLNKGQVAKLVVVNNEHVDVYLKTGTIRAQTGSKFPSITNPNDKGPAFNFKISTVDRFGKDLDEAEKNISAEGRPVVNYDSQVDYMHDIIPILFPFLLFVIIIGVGILNIYIVRAIFSIPIFLNHQKAQTKLLSKIAQKNGVSDENIKEILDEFQIK